jgi:MFS family permease
VALAENRYHALLAFGSSYSVGAQMASLQSVMPFILAAKGVYWAAGLVYSVFSVGIIAGNALSQAAVERSRRRQYLVIAIVALANAVLTVFVAASARFDVLVAVVFLSSSLFIGVARGIARNTYAEIISCMLDRRHRNQLVLDEHAIGAVVIVAATLLLIPLLAGRDAANGHLDVLWFGAVAMAVAFVAALAVGPTTSGAMEPRRPMLDDLRASIAVARTHSWYRLFLAAQIVFVPVTLSVTFFSLRASTTHGDKTGGLHLLVITSAAGMLVGSFLWRSVFRRFGVRGMLVCSGAFGSVAAVFCIVNETALTQPQLWVYGIVFFFAALANAAIYAATVSWISAFAEEVRREMLLSFAAALAAIATALFGVVVGWLAHVTDSTWPVVIVLAMCALAAAVAGRAPEHPPTAG